MAVTACPTEGHLDAVNCICDREGAVLVTVRFDSLYRQAAEEGLRDRIVPA
jgi:hypothetical protein